MDDIDDIMNADEPAEELSDDAASVASGGDPGETAAPADDTPDSKPEEPAAAAGTGIELDDFADDPVTEEASSGQQANGQADADSGREGRAAAELHAVFDVPVHISAVLGHTEIAVSDMLQLDTGAIIKLDRKVGEAIDIYVNDRLVARGEVVIVDNRLGITMTEIIKQETA